MIERVDHIGIAVPSIAEGRLFYEALGLSVERVEEVAAEGVRVAFIPCGESSIELLEPLDEASAVGRFLARRGPGVHHICLATSNLEADDRRLRDAGYRLLREEPSHGAGNCWIQFVHPQSAGGVLVELSQQLEEDPS